MSTLISVRLTAIEAVLLFQLMEIPEGQTLYEEFSQMEEKWILDESLTVKVMGELEKAGLVQLNGKQIIIKSELLELLKACKYSSVVSRFHVLDLTSKTSLTYAFISGSQVVEMRFSSDSGDVIFTSLVDGVEEMVSRLGELMVLPVSENNSYSIQLQPQTFKDLQTQLTLKDRGVYETILLKDDLADELAMCSLIESCRSLNQWGSLDLYIRGTDIQSQKTYYIGSPAGHWIFIHDQDGMLRGFQVTEPELIQSFYLITTRTLSIFVLR
ncbi:hypothetical protein ACK8P5_13710 [Paenibacillus sp. EC2-1]|uniref:hypothetical protein n=1 Tax=Paenibacillus sp. EC2-1 TaxID=3388665 RepID=UPI003BEEC6C2